MHIDLSEIRNFRIQSHFDFPFFLDFPLELKIKYRIIYNNTMNRLCFVERPVLTVII